MKTLTTYFVLLLLVLPVYAQADLDLQKTLSGYVNPDELVTLSENIPFNQAVAVLSQISEKLTGKKIVSSINLTTPVGVEINKMPYKKALIIVTRYNDLVYDEGEFVILIRRKADADKAATGESYASVDSREVKISALFFEANVTEMRERGINWELLFSKAGLSIGSKIKSFTEQQEAAGSEGAIVAEPPDFTIDTETEFTMGDFSGSATAAFKFFESENIGEIISRPSVTVRDNMKGRIQIGSDISIKQRDFSGNIIDNFYSTGTIIEVTPFIFNEDDVDYVLLKLRVERSSAEPGDVTTEIRKTSADTQILMLHEEETVIGGLFVNEELNVRRGIPILKDLPWWVFGIRYLAGYDQKQLTKKEVIILIKTEIVPTLKERIAQQKENLLENQMLEHEKDFKYYKSGYKKEEE